MEGNKLSASRLIDRWIDRQTDIEHVGREPLFTVHSAQLTRSSGGGLRNGIVIILPCCSGVWTAKMTDMAISALKTSLPIVRLWQRPWENAGRAAQSHQRGAGQKMHRDEEKQSPEGRRKEVSWQNPTKWHVGERTRKLELSGQCTETKYISGISNWLSHGFGYHNLLIETEKLVQENGMYFFSPLLDFVLKI